MAWYGQDKQLQTLILNKPKLADLLCYSDFIKHLKSYNAVLLDYLSNSITIPREIVQYLSIPPTDQDTPDRKYKLPLLTIQMVESEATCIINTLFKTDQNGTVYLLSILKNILRSKDVLPLLAGYFYRLNICLLNIKPKQTIDLIYSSQENLLLLAAHPQNPILLNTLQLYLNLEQTKNTQIQQRTNLKLKIIQQLFEIIKHAISNITDDTPIIIENIVSLIVDTLDRYYLLVDGKMMVDVICYEDNIMMMCDIMLAERPQSFAAMIFFLSLLRFYSCSVLNADDANEIAKKTLDKLQGVPLVNIICNTFDLAMSKILTADRMTIYLYKLLEVYCHATTLSSYRIFNKIKEIHFYQSLIDLLFKYEHCNILHMLIERALLHIFVTDKKIYEHYKKYLFCELSIIDLTAGRLINILNDGNLHTAQKYPFFGTLMKIIKIYSGIQTFDEEIANAIKSKSEVWKKVTDKLIKPYEEIKGKDLGTYDILDQNVNIFTVKNTEDTYQHKFINNDNAIQEVKRQQAVPINIKIIDNITGELKKEQNKQTLQDTPTNIKDDNFFEVPQPTHQLTTPILSQENKQIKRSDSFKEFMSKKTVEVGEQIKIQRSASFDKKISAQKARMTSPSPKKKNSWKEESQEEKKQQKQARPHRNRIPTMAINSNFKPSNSLIFSKQKEVNGVDRMAKSMIALQQYGKIKIMRVQKPNDRQFKRFNQRDKNIFSLLGIID